MRSRRLIYTLASLTTCMLLTSCVLPIPLPPGGNLRGTRGNLGERIPDFIVPGVTTREDVLMHLGEADGRSKDGSELNYVSRANRGGIGLLIFPVGATDYQRELQRTLIVEFDKAGLVKSTRLQVESCSVITGYWAHSPDQTTTSCVPVGEPVVLGDAPKAASPEPEP